MVRWRALYHYYVTLFLVGDKADMMKCLCYAIVLIGLRRVGGLRVVSFISLHCQMVHCSSSIISLSNPSMPLCMPIISLCIALGENIQTCLLIHSHGWWCYLVTIIIIPHTHCQYTCVYMGVLAVLRGGWLSLHNITWVYSVVFFIYLYFEY